MMVQGAIAYDSPKDIQFIDKTINSEAYIEIINHFHNKIFAHKND